MKHQFIGVCGPHLVDYRKNQPRNVTFLKLPESGQIFFGSPSRVDNPDVIVDGVGVQAHHASIICTAGEVVLVPYGMCSIDGIRCHKPSVLKSGSMICLGRSNYFKFMCPAADESHDVLSVSTDGGTNGGFCEQSIAQSEYSYTNGHYSDSFFYGSLCRAACRCFSCERSICFSPLFLSAMSSFEYADWETHLINVFKCSLLGIDFDAEFEDMRNIHPQLFLLPYSFAGSVEVASSSILSDTPVHIYSVHDSPVVGVSAGAIYPPSSDILSDCCLSRPSGYSWLGCWLRQPDSAPVLQTDVAARDAEGCRHVDRSPQSGSCRPMLSCSPSPCSTSHNRIKTNGSLSRDCSFSALSRPAIASRGCGSASAAAVAAPAAADDDDTAVNGLLPLLPHSPRTKIRTTLSSPRSPSHDFHPPAPSFRRQHGALSSHVTSAEPDTGTGASSWHPQAADHCSSACVAARPEPAHSPTVTIGQRDMGQLNWSDAPPELFSTAGTNGQLSCFNDAPRQLQQPKQPLSSDTGRLYDQLKLVKLASYSRISQLVGRKLGLERDQAETACGAEMERRLVSGELDACRRQMTLLDTGRQRQRRQLADRQRDWLQRRRQSLEQLQVLSDRVASLERQLNATDQCAPPAAHQPSPPRSPLPPPAAAAAAAEQSVNCERLTGDQERRTCYELLEAARKQHEDREFVHMELEAAWEAEKEDVSAELVRLDGQWRRAESQAVRLQRQLAVLDETERRSATARQLEQRQILAAMCTERDRLRAIRHQFDRLAQNLDSTALPEAAETEAVGELVVMEPVALLEADTITAECCSAALTVLPDCAVHHSPSPAAAAAGGGGGGAVADAGGTVGGDDVAPHLQQRGLNECSIAGEELPCHLTAGLRVSAVAAPAAADAAAPDASACNHVSPLPSHSSRPVSGASSVFEDADDGGDQSKLTPPSWRRRQPGANGSARHQQQQQQRPLTRYMPVLHEQLDLRQHVEAAAHSAELLVGQLVLTATACRGHLHKLSGAGGGPLRVWRRRWFVFERSSDVRALLYYGDSGERRVRGGAPFAAIQDVYVQHGGAASGTTFCVRTRRRLFRLQAPSAAAMRVWVDVIMTGAEGHLAIVAV